MSVTERPLQTPCDWCGRAVRQPARGRLLRYCDRSCRQRAYEARTAQRRLHADVDAGRVRTQPAERIVERVVRAKYPHTAAGWEQALEEMRAQLADGRLRPWHADRLQRAVAAVSQQLQETGDAWLAATARRPPEPVYDGDLWAPYVPVGDARLVAIEDRIDVAGGSLSTTLERLALDVAMSVDELRAAVLEFESDGLLTARRHGAVVPVDELAVHARFDLAVT